MVVGQHTRKKKRSAKMMCGEQVPKSGSLKKNDHICLPLSSVNERADFSVLAEYEQTLRLALVDEAKERKIHKTE